MKQQVVAKTKDLKDGEMKGVKVGDTDVLLSKIDGQFHAVGAFCPHYGAPLEMGILSGDRIVCPWHHACFSARTGDLLEPPSRDALPQFEVAVKGEDVVVSVPDDAPAARTPKMAKQDVVSEERTFVIVGGGAAGNAAAQALRENGFRGRIVMIVRENRYPYDRPNLSKDYLQGKAEEEWMPLRSPDFYQLHNIEVLFNRNVVHVDTLEKAVEFEDGDDLTYDALLLATGGIARNLDAPGKDLANVFTLRSYDDSDAIISACKNASDAVVVGASFIGMETAYSLKERGLRVTVVARDEIPFRKIFGDRIGKLLQKLHEDRGINFKLGTTVSEFAGRNQVETVVLDDGVRIKANLVVVGVGVRPATEFLSDTDLVEPEGDVKVDDFLCASKDVYAAGDIARFRDVRTQEYSRIEHWRTAEQQGRIAAMNMAGKATAYDSVPFFWTSQAGLQLRYVGHTRDWDDIIFDGDINSKNFVACYVKNGQMVAAAGCGRDQQMAAIEELMRLKQLPEIKKIKEDSFDWIAALKKRS